MSYYSQQNVQQKSAGLFLVIAFHILLIWALATGLLPKVFHRPDPKNVQVTIVDEVVSPKPTVQPSEPSNREAPLVNPLNPPEIPTYEPIKSTASVDPIDNSGVLIAPSTTRASIKRAPKPEYPTTSTRFNEQGTTGMRVSIDPTGHVTNAVVVSSSGYERLDQAAVKHAMRNWLFNPCTENGKAVSCDQNVKLTWKLEEAR